MTSRASTAFRGILTRATGCITPKSWKWSSAARPSVRWVRSRRQANPMIKWGVLSNYIQNGVLKDPKSTKYTDTDLLIWARWACVEISYHTAELAQQVYECDGEGYQFDLPDDMVDDVEHTGLVGIDDGTKVTWLPSLRLDPNATWQWPVVQSTAVSSSSSLLSASNSGGFYEWPSNCLTLSFVPKASERLVVRYFKIWDPPAND